MDKFAFKAPDAVSDDSGDGPPRESTIGVGGPAEGVALDKIIAKISNYIENEKQEERTVDPRALFIEMPKFELDADQMRKLVTDMDDPEFWLQQA